MLKRLLFFKGNLAYCLFQGLGSGLLIILTILILPLVLALGWPYLFNQPKFVQFMIFTAVIWEGITILQLIALSEYKNWKSVFIVLFGSAVVTFFATFFWASLFEFLYKAFG